VNDLSLIPLEELLNEAQGRCETFICAYELPKEVEKEAMFKYGEKGNWMNSVKLASILNNDVMNNWNGELKTLQRINKDED
jgi:hypothetical protein